LWNKDGWLKVSYLAVIKAGLRQRKNLSDNQQRQSTTNTQQPKTTTDSNARQSTDSTQQPTPVKQ
jgi:hypothetical protein